MTPAARVQAAIEILTALQDTAQPADRFLRDWFRSRRYAGSNDRAAIAERIYDVFRHRASYMCRMGSEDARSLVIASVLSQTSPEQIAALFDGSRYGPARVSEAEELAIANPPRGEPPLWVRGEFPEWLERELKRSLGDDLLAEMEAMQSRAPIDLRVNTLKTMRDTVRAELQALGFDATLSACAPKGLRLKSAASLSALERTELFQSGAFEFQDEGSQIIAHLVDAKPGERILDFAAGAGGKSLCMAADMRNQGEIVAYDVAPERMKRLSARASRAGATIIQLVTDVDALRYDAFDAVLVDAPCSGSGTWRRNPDAKWRLSPAALEHFHPVQEDILNHAALFVRPGGRLIYATCSLFKWENEDVVAAFLERKRFTRVALEQAWSRLIVCKMPTRSSHDFRATPLQTGTDGFFASIMLRGEANGGRAGIGV